MTPAAEVAQYLKNLREQKDPAAIQEFVLTLVPGLIETLDAVQREFKASKSKQEYRGENNELARYDAEKRVTQWQVKADCLGVDLRMMTADRDKALVELSNVYKALLDILGVKGPEDTFFNSRAASFNIGQMQIEGAQVLLTRVKKFLEGR